MTLSVTLVRHGETEWALSGRHTGRTDVPLTAHGEREARGLKPAIDAIAFDRVFTSPALRARRTCALAGLEGRAEIEPDLAEWDYGAYEGRRSAAIREERPGWTIYRDGCPGGETAADVSERVDRLIARLRSLDGAVALFSHGQFGCGLAARWIGLPIVFAQHFELGTASLSTFGSKADDSGVPVIAHWNMHAFTPLA